MKKEADLEKHVAEVIFHTAGGTGWGKADQGYYRMIARAAIATIKGGNHEG